MFLTFSTFYMSTCFFVCFFKPYFLKHSRRPQPSLRYQVRLLRAAREAYLMLAGSGLCGTLEGADFWCMPTLWKNAGVGGLLCPERFGVLIIPFSIMSDIYWTISDLYFQCIDTSLCTLSVHPRLDLLGYVSSWSWSRRWGKKTLDFNIHIRGQWDAIAALWKFEQLDLACVCLLQSILVLHSLLSLKNLLSDHDFCRQRQLSCSKWWITCQRSLRDSWGSKVRFWIVDALLGEVSPISFYREP